MLYMGLKQLIKVGFRNTFSMLCLLLCVCNIGCNKLVQIPNPISSVTAEQVFNTDATATSAILGIYSSMNSNPSFASGEITFAFSESADELTDESSGNEYRDQQLCNTLTALGNSSTSLGFWQPAYYYIYNANAIISGVQASTGMSAGAKTELTSEAKFIRAFCYFYLTNIFGDLPLVLNSDFNQTALLSRTSQSKIYQQIVADLLDAQSSLPADFSLSGGMPIRANKWAATALLARVYLYQGQWTSADSAASAVINSGQFKLAGIDSVFFANSPEAILQLQTPNTYPNATWEGFEFIPYPGNQPHFWLTFQLFGAFEPNDLRWSTWVDSTNANGPYQYYPLKYTVQSGNAAKENYMVLRLAEQYLIRGEAKAYLNQLGAAINDLNSIRTRAGLDSLLPTLTQPQVLAAVQQEDRIEFFAEWGHRWFDLKRWGIALQTLDTIPYKIGNIDSTQLLYPIPTTEIQTDPNLSQNRGY
jgi:hypothetical protein